MIYPQRLAATAALAACAVLTVWGSAAAQAVEEPARYEPASRGPRAVIEEAAERNGVPAGPLIALAVCESRLDPGARGDYGRSHGLYQLNDLRGTGLLWHFYAVGYTDAYDADQAADYVARVYAGEWARDGVTLRRWSCWR